MADLEPPAPGHGDVRERITAAGVCHSGLSMINGTLTPKFPLVLGHEASGAIAETGDWAAACRALVPPAGR